MATGQPDAKSFKDDTRVANTHKDEIQELQDELASMNPTDAVPSSVEYYQSTKDQSYPVNPANVQRGRAIVVSMTENREGWKEDVRALHRLFLSLSIHTEHVFDPDTEELINRLTLFAKSEENKHVDCIFVILMGHGYGQGANTFLQTKSKGFEIWSNCSKIFNESAHHLNEKPKIFLAQVCRGQQTVDPVKVENPPARPLEDHLLVFASQPGEFAQRDARGSRFVQQFTNVLPDYSHKMHVEGMIKIVRQIFAAVNRISSTSKQMCQVWTTTIYDVNLFPGIKESELEPVETIDVRNAGPVEGSKADSRVVSLEYQVPTGNGLDLQLKVRLSVLPEDPEKAALIQKELVLKCQNQQFINGLSQCLSKEIGSHISVKNVTTGSFTLHCNMTNYAIIDYIKYLCDTDIIGNTLERLLVTNELKASHHVNYICLNASIEENSYNEILQFLEACRIPRMPTSWQMEDHEAYLADDVSIECEANGEVQWYKNGSRLRVNPRIIVTKGNGFSCLKIKGACMADGGFYECHQFAPKHTITKCRLVVYDYGCPSDVRATPLSSNVASVTWKAALGNVTGYKVFYHLTTAPEINGMVAVGGQKTETCDITNLLPGQEYSLSVVSLNGPFESRVPETGTFSLKLHPSLIRKETERMSHQLQSEKETKEPLEGEEALRKKKKELITLKKKINYNCRIGTCCI